MAEENNAVLGHIDSTKRAQFGSRYLTDPDNVFKHNAWDNVEWDEEQEESARKVIEKQQEVVVPEEMGVKYECEADSYWDAFYTQHDNRFFKDRHWLFTEFPELLTLAKRDSAESVSVSSDVRDSVSTEYPGHKASAQILEVGCGAGNTVFPILEATKDKGSELFIYACDFSATAVDIVKSHNQYEESRCHTFVCDVTSPTSQSFPFPPASLDCIIMIFVLSAIHPAKMQSCISTLSQYLKPGGLLLFRDYGRYDMAQLRFKQGRCLRDNFYVRGDGTRCYFFTQDELDAMFRAAGLVKVQNLVDRRLQVNRGRKLKMYRVWIQCKYRREVTGDGS